MNEIALAMTARHHRRLATHLFPGDGYEAAAILICGRAGDETLRLCVQDVIEIPHNECSSRTPDRLSWPGSYLDLAMDKADQENASLILIHSHPGGLFEFSEIDDHSDTKTIPCLFHGMTNSFAPHGSAIMVPGGSIKARLYCSDMSRMSISIIQSIGTDIEDLSQTDGSEITAFTSQMSDYLSSQTACVVGVSGTGSLVAEMLARMGFGKLILVDFDSVEGKNLNRVLNSTVRDAQENAPKTFMMRRAIQAHHPATTVVCVQRSIADRDAIIAASDAHVIFSCVDTMEARFYCDLMASSFVSPLIDMGVTIPTRKQSNGSAAIADVCGRVDYVFPDGASLGDRGVWSPEGLRGEYLASNAPDELQAQIEAGYIKGIVEEAPSVISLNMRAASAAVNEYVFRLFKIRHDGNMGFSSTFFSLAGAEEDHEADTHFVKSENTTLGRGLKEPLLGQPSLAPPLEDAA